LATVQMPAGIPVATMAIGKAGARNAGIFAAQILAIENPEIADKLVVFKNDMAEKVAAMSRSVQERLVSDGL
jgi:phosphoribosylaminoimidazole carboxylase PurE protein